MIRLRLSPKDNWNYASLLGDLTRDIPIPLLPQEWERGEVMRAHGYLVIAEVGVPDEESARSIEILKTIKPCPSTENSGSSRPWMMPSR